MPYAGADVDNWFDQGMQRGIFAVCNRITPMIT